MVLPLVIIGVSGSGKSAVGQRVAARQGRPFFDADTFHPASNVAKMAGGRPLSDADRAPWLDRLARLLRDEPRGVLACSALRRAYRSRLAAGRAVFFVYLAVDRDTLRARLRSRRSHFMPESLLDSQLRTLEVPAPDERAAVIDGGRPLDQVVDQVVAAAADASRE